MTPDKPTLEESLAQFTRWKGPSPELWKKALDEHAGPTATIPRRVRFPASLRISRPVLAAAAMLLLATVIGIMLVSQAQVHQTSRIVESEPRRALQQEHVHFAEASPLAPPASQAVEMWSRSANRERRPHELSGIDADWVDTSRAELTEGRRQRAREQPPARHVIRRISLELHHDDVRAVFARAQLIPSAARGEYIQSSSLTGEGKDARAELTLRIAADRLDEALNELRALGQVHAEHASGEDVTAQVVDLEARLRNEQRIEAELVQLLDKRPDSPLAEVLQVRRSLDEVRQRIEQLSGQRQHFQRLVSLATVLVIIRPSAEDDDPKPAGAILDYFKERLLAAWHTGIHFLADSLGLLLTLVVGGLVWWLLLVVLAALWVQHRRRGIALGHI
jgi:hypothetical protein